MNDVNRSDARIAALIDAYADRAPTDVDPVAIARSTVTRSERSTVLDRLLRRRGTSTASGRPPMQPMIKVGAALAAITVAVVGVVLITPPSPIPGDTSSAEPSAAGPTVLPSEAAEAPPGAAPVEFTGLWKCGPPLTIDRTETLDLADGGSMTRYRDGAWRQATDMSDPRLEGEIYQSWESDSYYTAGATAGPQVAAWTYRVENDGGAWEGRAIEARYADGATVGKVSNVLVGEGGYAGLYAIWEVTADVGECDAEVRGLIFDGVPEPQPVVPAVPG